MKHLRYPTGQCLERWLAAGPRYAGHMDRPIILLETQTKVIELVLGGMRQKQTAKRLGVSIGAISHCVKAYREDCMAALCPKNRNAGRANKPALRRDRDAGDAEALRRRIEELKPGERADAGGSGTSQRKIWADLRCLDNREKILPVDRPGSTYSPGSMTCLLGIALSSHPCFSSIFLK